MSAATPPRSVAYVSAVPVPSVGNNVWNIGTVAAGSSGTIVITVVVTAGSGWINNTVVLEYTTDPGFVLPVETVTAPTLVINPLM